MTVPPRYKMAVERNVEFERRDIAPRMKFSVVFNRVIAVPDIETLARVVMKRHPAETALGMNVMKSREFMFSIRRIW